MKPASNFWPLWGWPVAYGVLTLVGLLAGLLGDGPADWLSWLALGAPVAATLWYGWLRGRRRETR